VIDSYYAWTSVNFNAEPPRLDEKLGLDYLGLPGTNGPSRLYGGWPQFNISNYANLGNPGSAANGGPVVDANRQISVHGERFLDQGLPQHPVWGRHREAGPDSL